MPYMRCTQDEIRKYKIRHTTEIGKNGFDFAVTMRGNSIEFRGSFQKKNRMTHDHMLKCIKRQCLSTTYCCRAQWTQCSYLIHKLSTWIAIESTRRGVRTFDRFEKPLSFVKYCAQYVRHSITSHYIFSQQEKQKCRLELKYFFPIPVTRIRNKRRICAQNPIWKAFKITNLFVIFLLFTTRYRRSNTLIHFFLLFGIFCDAHLYLFVCMCHTCAIIFVCTRIYSVWSV